MIRVECDHCGRMAQGQQGNPELCEHCGAVLPEREPPADQCQAPGCTNITDRGICDDCNRWVDDQVRKERRLDRRLGRCA